MNLAVAVSLFAAAVNLTSGTVHVAISGAPGWRVARVSAFIACSAGLYSLLSAIFGLEGLALDTYLAVARTIYVVAALHASAWVVYAYGGPDASFRRVPRVLQQLLITILALTLVLAVTGFHLQRAVSVVDVPWAGCLYHYPLATRIGDVYGLGLTATRSRCPVFHGPAMLRDCM